jgi:four helix bundle protein
VASRFRDLDAYRLAVQLAQDVYSLVSAWPSFDRWSLGMQLVRAADSVGANIAESSGRWHRNDKRRLLIIARGSLYEAEHWIGLARMRGLISDESVPQLAPLARALNGLVKQPTPTSPRQRANRQPPTAN